MNRGFMILVCLLLLPGVACAEDMTWDQIRRALDKCYAGWDLSIDLSGGVERREFEEEARTAPFAEARITVPIYGAKQRRQICREHSRELERLADMVAEIEAAKAQLEIKREMVAVLHKTLIEDGAKSIEQYFRIQEDIAALDARITAQQRKLQSWVELCGDL